MLVSNLSEKELEFLEHYYDPTSLTENLFPEKFSSPQVWNKKERRFWIRMYQLVMQNFFWMYADDPDLSFEENFKNKKGAGDLYSIGSRNTGKSVWVIIDCVLAVLHGIPQSCVASFDEGHLKNVIEPIAAYIQNHPFMKLFHLRVSKTDSVKTTPHFKAVTEHGAVMHGVNEQAGSDDPGVQYHSKHFFYHNFEEVSYMSAEGYKKSIDAENSAGHIKRFSGIPDLCIGSPLGKILTNEKLKPWIWCAPQLVRSDWTENVEKEKEEEYGGKASSGYLLNVLAQTVEGAYGYFDMVRLKKQSVTDSGIVKSFEIDKDSFANFQQNVIIQVPPGTISTYIAADIGLGAAPSEIIIICYDGKKYRYVYNITLFRLIQKEQAEVFYWLYQKFGSPMISCDSSGDGGVIIDYLKDKGVPEKKLLKVKFYDLIEVDFERDENGNWIFDRDGKPVMIKEETKPFSMTQLAKIMYSGDEEIPPDAKFLSQFTNCYAKQSKLKTIFENRGPDHLLQAFQVYAICRFFNEFNMNNNTSNERSYGVFNKR